MLAYMSMLNLLSDWTCYSVAPIALLTIDAFGEVDPESLVTVFLGANAVASAMEPAILGRLGLRRTVVFGAALLMIGSIIKSADDEDNVDITWRLYLGFFLVGLSQPLYQCTPALLSASWFPENERTMATGVALNSNQLGIGCAFVFGTMLVATKEDILPYFGLLSVISTIAFVGAALQFDDAPPTPPSDTARVIKGDLEIKIPNISFIVQQFKACFARKGFAHCVVAFTTSGIIVNTLSTFMDYLVTLNGAGREYVGIVGGTFQLFIMFASLVFGGWTDHSRKYYFVILAMLILGAFALAVCNTDLDSDAGGALRWHLLVVAVLAGPLQPISTELGVEVVYPLSENTVLVIQQLFSNLLSAAFIPVFKALKDVGTVQTPEKEMFEVPQFTFSFYMLIIIHACSTMYFATFNGKYLRYEDEEKKKAKKEAKKQKLIAEMQRNGGYGAVDEGMNGMN
ncbi:hypothetical protein ACHAWC_006678 [Mediolabrus comicus]